jgi:L-alanine-DL-glutamate epimerase-like enolase superfamily enzyme
VAAARRERLDLMVGNMCGSSLAMAPAMAVAAHCRFVDLDGPLLQSEDVTDALVYDGARVRFGERWPWGRGRRT